MANMVKTEDWLGTIPSPQIRKNYKNGIRRFEEFYTKSKKQLEQKLLSVHSGNSNWRR